MRLELARARFLRFGVLFIGAALAAAALADSERRMSPPASPDSLSASPPASEESATDSDPTTPTATAAVVKSWSGCNSNQVVWRKLNQDWAQFGDVRIQIDFRNRALCDPHNQVSYEALEASGVQTLILSDPAGGLIQFYPAEIDAISRYVLEGHNLIGTYLTLQHDFIDNSGLAPLFGLDPRALYPWRRHAIGPYTLRPHAPLFDGLGGTYNTGGFIGSQLPPVDHWTNAAAEQARILAYTLDRRAAILQYCGDGFRSILFTQMPEYGGSNVQDQTVLYNALVMGRRPGCRQDE